MFKLLFKIVDRGERFDWLLLMKTGFHWLLRRKGRRLKNKRLALRLIIIITFCT